jgi:DNA polymerase alpha subunit B
VDEVQRVIGRVVNLNQEESKLNDTNVGLLNLSEENSDEIRKIKLILGELKSYSLFDGEIVVAEGTYDTTKTKLNVMAIHKPHVGTIPRSLLSLEQIRQLCVDNYHDRALQVLVACGPFTFKNSLSYQGLHDFLGMAKKEQPQAIILMGPFLDMANVDISNGDLFFDNRDNSKTFVSHEELFKDLVNTIQKELQGVTTSVIFVPSHKDVHHFEPLPQAPYLQNYFPTPERSHPTSFMVAPNPSMIYLNEIKVGVINTDIVKDLCTSMLPVNMTPPKIDLSLRALLEQRMYYPLYPGNPETPIEYD